MTLSEPMLVYCQLEPSQQTAWKFQSKYDYFHSKKCILKCSLQKCRPFCIGFNVLTAPFYVLCGAMPEIMGHFNALMCTTETVTWSRPGSSPFYQVIVGWVCCMTTCDKIWYQLKCKCFVKFMETNVNWIRQKMTIRPDGFIKALPATDVAKLSLPGKRDT